MIKRKSRQISKNTQQPNKGQNRPVQKASRRKPKRRAVCAEKNALVFASLDTLSRDGKHAALRAGICAVLRVGRTTVLRAVKSNILRALRCAVLRAVTCPALCAGRSAVRHAGERPCCKSGVVLVREMCAPHGRNKIKEKRTEETRPF